MWMKLFHELANNVLNNICRKCNYKKKISQMKLNYCIETQKKLNYYKSPLKIKKLNNKLKKKHVVEDIYHY